MVRLLMIEDEPQIRELLQEVLEQAGYEVMSFSEGQAGFREYKRSKFELVIMDIRLPDQHGFDTLREFHQLDEQVKVLVISGEYLPENKHIPQHLEHLGVRKILAKPFELSDFLEVINQLTRVPPSPSI